MYELKTMFSNLKVRNKTIIQALTREYAEYPKKTIQGKHVASVIVVNTFY